VVRVTLDGTSLDVPPGRSIAAALLSVGVRALRCSPRAGAPRGAFCLMGVCQECLISADGKTVQACLVPVANGMALRRLG
jgi:predicted molibdopterin-dependent oxidoreductase YjgC